MSEYAVLVTRADRTYKPYEIGTIRRGAQTGVIIAGTVEEVCAHLKWLFADAEEEAKESS